MSTSKREFEQQNYTAGYVLDFNCGQAGNLVPAVESFDEKEVYRNIEYVINKCKKLDKQLKELE